MSATIPAEVLALKTRFDQWRATRSHIRERVPDELREAVVKLARRYPPALIRRVLKVDPWRMNGSVAGKPASARGKSAAAFFQLPIEVSAPAPVSTANDATGIRLQFSNHSRTVWSLRQGALPVPGMGLTLSMAWRFISRSMVAYRFVVLGQV